MKVAFITMQKNEGAFLDLFVRHHEKISGLNNIYIIDNGSDNELTKEMLRSYKKKGVNVIYGFDSKEDFENKGDVIKQIMAAFSFSEKYDFMIPIDCDELFILYRNNQVVFDGLEIINYLSGLEDRGCGFRINYCLNNLPKLEDKFKLTPRKKAFFSKESNINKIDTGFHLRNMDDKLVLTSACFLHFHNRSYFEQLKSSRSKLALRVENFSKKYLDKYQGNHKNRGWHLARYFITDENNYYKSLEGTNGGKYVTCSAREYFDDLRVCYPYSEHTQVSEIDLFWIKSPSNIYTMSEQIREYLQLQFEKRSLCLSFGAVSGFASGNVLYADGLGYGWLGDEIQQERDRHLKDALLSKFCISFSENKKYRVDLPKGKYRVKILSHDSEYDNHLLALSINNGELLNGENKKEFCSIYSYYCNNDLGFLEIEFSSKQNNFVVNGIVIEPVDALLKNSFKLESIEELSSTCLKKESFEGLCENYEFLNRLGYVPLKG